MAKKKETKPVFITNRACSVRINLSDVMYAESDDHQTVLHMKDGCIRQTSVSLSSLEQQLPPDQFVRIHRQYVVNIWSVTRIINQILVFPDGSTLPVGRTYQQSFFSQIIVISEAEKKS